MADTGEFLKLAVACLDEAERDVDCARSWAAVYALTSPPSPEAGRRIAAQLERIATKLADVAGTLADMMADADDD